MRSLVAAALISATMLLAGGALSFVGFCTSGDHSAAAATGDASLAASGNHSHSSHGSGAFGWAGGKGTIPTLADALLDLERRGAIIITNDAGFNPANGVRSGTGTYDDPFMITGYFVDQVLIADTSKAFVFSGNYVGDILILDWTGQGGYVHHNHLNNMRTNRNVDRTGDPSATVIEKNLILEIEQLRHFDGEVRNNTIGDANALPLLGGNDVVFDIAGLNGAGIHHNVIYGGVDMKIHGHHHSDKPGTSSHNHGQADAQQNESHFEDHQVRYVDFEFYSNRIIDNGFGLRYNDLNHAGDDRTATSEQEPALEEPHTHFTTVTLRDNTIEGATLRLAIVNSADERHVGPEHAVINILGNRIVKPLSGDGIVLSDVRNATVEIQGNVVDTNQLVRATSAIFLQRFANSTILVGENSFGEYKYGVRAREFDALTTWDVAANRGSAQNPVYWDESVANPPGGAGGEHAHAHTHDSDAPPAAAPAEPALIRFASTFATGG